MTLFPIASQLDPRCHRETLDLFSVAAGSAWLMRAAYRASVGSGRNAMRRTSLTNVFDEVETTCGRYRRGTMPRHYSVNVHSGNVRADLRIRNEGSEVRAFENPAFRSQAGGGCADGCRVNVLNVVAAKEQGVRWRAFVIRVRHYRAFLLYNSPTGAATIRTTAPNSASDFRKRQTKGKSCSLATR
jgi:hypothetical protein